MIFIIAMTQFTKELYNIATDCLVNGINDDDMQENAEKLESILMSRVGEWMRSFMHDEKTNDPCKGEMVDTVLARYMTLEGAIRDMTEYVKSK